MNKHQAYEAMCQGHKVCNEYYTPEEYAFLNDNSLIEYEDGCVVGDQFSENWVKYQDPECKLEWSIWKSKEELIKGIDPEIKNQSMSTPEPFILHNTHKDYYCNPIISYPKPFVSKNSHKRTNKRK